MSIFRFRSASLGLMFAPVLLVSVAASAEGEPLASWVELVDPDGTASIRAIVSEDEQCPKLEVDGKGVSMDVRAEPGPLFSSGPDVPAAEFPVRVCEATA